MPELPNFDSILSKEEGFRYAGNDYTLKQPSGATKIKFLKRTMRGARMVDGKLCRDQVEDIAGLPLYLLSMCLFDSKGNALSEAVIGEWPNQVIDPLFEKAKEWCDLNKKEEDEEASKKS